MYQLITVFRAAELLALKPSTIRKMILQRRLSVVRIGRAVRIREGDLETIVREGYRKAIDMNEQRSV